MPSLLTPLSPGARRLRRPPGGPVSPRREIARIAVPVSLEFVFMLVLNFVNQVVVGALGATAIAAVGFANSLVFILVLTLGALGASVSILVARAHGSGRRHEMNASVTAALLAAGLLAAATSAPAFLAAGSLLRLTGASPTVAAVGTGYLRLMTLSLVPTVLSAVLSGVMRSTGHARSPMVATLVTVLLNTSLGYCLVFGVGPLPELGVVGAGWATLATAVLKAVILLGQVLLRHRLVRWELPAGRSSGAPSSCRSSCSRSRSASPSCSGPPARSSTTWCSSGWATTRSPRRRSQPRWRGSSSSAASG